MANRQQRRASKSKGKRAPGLARAKSQVDATLDALKAVKGLEGTVNQLSELQTDIQQANTLMEAMVGDIQTLNAELEAQREINLHLMSCVLAPAGDSREDVLLKLREDEQRIRAEVQEKHQADSTDEKG